MSSPKNPYITAFLTTLYEFILTVLPVGIYVSLEALHKHDIYWLFFSPEWAIASIFLAFQTYALCFKRYSEAKFRLNTDFNLLLFVLAIIITICASINAYISLEYEYWSKIGFRIALFFLTIILFFFLVMSAILKSEEKR